MALPTYEAIMLPLLRLLADGQEHLTNQNVEALATHFSLTDEERRQLLPSGRQTVFLNRVHWATTYLTKAGLIERTGRGRIRITDRGREVLHHNPPRIDDAFLMQFPEFRDFKKRQREPSQPKEPASTTVAHLDPEELLESSYQRLRQALAEELLERIKNAPPPFFEKLVIDLLVAMGYGGSYEDAARAVGRTGDDGIDGIIKQDRLGLDFVYVQAKRWNNPVGRPIVQAFAGSLEGQRAHRGVMITTSTFTDDARDYVTRIEKRIVLIDGNELAHLMIDYGVGVTDVQSYHVKRIDAGYFGEE